MKKIFSGPYSGTMWHEIQKLDARSTVDDIRNVIYLVCCRLQEFEDSQSATHGGEKK